jgi:hypothetical protein
MQYDVLYVVFESEGGNTHTQGVSLTEGEGEDTDRASLSLRLWKK